MGSVMEGIPSLLPVNVGPAFVGAYGQARDQRMKSDTLDFQKAQEVSAIVSKAAQLADTPQKWATTLGVLQKNFPQADLSAFQDFGSRDTVLAQLRDPYKDAELALQKTNAANAQSNADRTFAQGAQTPDIKEFVFAKQNGFAGSFEDWLKTGKPGSGETYYGQPIYTTDAEGNVNGVNAFSNRGNVKSLSIPGTVALPTGTPAADGSGAVAPPAATIKAPGSVKVVGQGTQSTVITPTGAKVGAPLPIDVAGAAAARASGAATGTAEQALPSVLNSSQRVIDAIDTALGDPALEGVIGPIQSRLPKVNQGQTRAQSEIDQILGGTFLQAYNDLRGAGQISNAEGQSAKAAYNRLQNTDMSDADYRAALTDFRNQVTKLMDIAKQRAGGGAQPQPGAVAPAPAAGGNWLDLGNGIRIRQLP
jgi:hypothetical protein